MPCPRPPPIATLDPFPYSLACSLTTLLAGAVSHYCMRACSWAVGAWQGVRYKGAGCSGPIGQVHTDEGSWKGKGEDVGDAPSQRQTKWGKRMHCERDARHGRGETGARVRSEKRGYGKRDEQGVQPPGTGSNMRRKQHAQSGRQAGGAPGGRGACWCRAGRYRGKLAGPNAQRGRAGSPHSHTPESHTRSDSHTTGSDLTPPSLPSGRASRFQ